MLIGVLLVGQVFVNVFVGVVYVFVYLFGGVFYILYGFFNFLMFFLVLCYNVEVVEFFYVEFVSYFGLYVFMDGLVEEMECIVDVVGIEICLFQFGISYNDLLCLVEEVMDVKCLLVNNL